MLLYHYEILKTAKESREKELIEYQVNIDNFKLAIELIGDDAELAEFKKHLKELLSSSQLEQRKAKIMYEVVSKQLNDVDENSLTK